MYDSDRGLEELAARREGEALDVAWLVAQMRWFIDEHPESEAPVGALATWLARAADDG